MTSNAAAYRPTLLPSAKSRPRSRAVSVFRHRSCANQMGEALASGNMLNRGSSQCRCRCS
jgi:hypothetical protein